MEITVNGEVIPDQVINQEKERLHMEPDSPPYDQLDGIVQDNLIARTLIRQGAAQAEIAIPKEDIDEALADMIEEAGGEDRFYSRYGITVEQEATVRDEIELTLKIERFLANITGQSEEPTAEEIQSFYQEHRDGLKQPEEAEASHIVKNVCCEDEAPQTYEEMRSIRRQLLEGADFLELADQHSMGDERGGYLGRFSRGNMLPEFEAIAFSMNPGEISPIFATQFGYHIVKVTDRTEEKSLDLEEATPAIREELSKRKKEALVEEWVEKAKAEAEISVNAG